MSYIGQTLPADTFQGFTTDSFTGDGSATTFTLSKTPFNESALLVVINNVVQKPTTNFTVSGTTLTIVGTAVASGDVIYATHIGGALPIGQAASLDLNGASDQLILDADADTTISADTDDQIDFKVAGTDQIKLTDGILAPTTTNDVDLGSTSLRFKDVAISNDIAHLDNAGNARTLYDRSENLLGNTGTNLTGASIYLGGTGSANQFEDYEEGTWTATLAGTGSSSGQGYDNQTMQYTKIGRIVYLTGMLDMSSLGTLGGDYLKITGLPFTPDASNSNSYQPITTHHVIVAGDVTGAEFGWTVYGANTFMYVYERTAGGAAQATTSGDYENGTIVGCSGAYITAA